MLEKASRLALLLFALFSQATSTARAADPGVKLNADGSVVVPTFVLPFSAYASPEAIGELKYRLGPRANSSLPNPWLESQKRRYSVTVTKDEIGGVGVQIFTPSDGVRPKNRHRVLINLHGGGFVGGWPENGQIESIPISSIGAITVVSVDYRLAPKNIFPAASEDVGKVYRALLRRYKPSDIGIYGCSAGGELTGQSIAWIQHLGLPRPAAIAILSGSTAKIDGDSLYVSGRIGGIFPSPSSTADAFLETVTKGYLSQSESGNPLMWPSDSPSALSSFPPTLLLNGSRSVDASATMRTHLDLTKAGAESRMYIWDGLDHCFMYNADLPESREAYNMVVHFFDEIMSRQSRR